MQKLSYEFISLIAEALGLQPDGLAQFYDTDEFMQHRSKVCTPCFLYTLRIDGVSKYVDCQVPFPGRSLVRSGRWPSLRRGLRAYSPFSSLFLFYRDEIDVRS